MNPIPSKVLCKVLVVRHVCIILQKVINHKSLCTTPSYLIPVCKNTTTQNEDHKHNSNPNGKEEKEKKIIP